MSFGFKVSLIFLGLTISAPIWAALRIGLVLDKGGKDDKSFNASAYQGAKEAKEKLGITLKVVETADDASIEPAMQTFSQHQYDLIIGIGFIQRSPVARVAKRFPKTHFLLIDANVNLPNVRSILFNEHEGSFLVGALAAMKTQTNTVGFVGGMDIPLIRRFELGYRAGIKHINPQIKVLVNYVGETSEAWRNPTKAKELALSQYSRKADIIFTPAGASGNGVFDAAEKEEKMVIGCDSNQNWVKPGRVLTSMEKRVNKAVFETIKLAVEGKFSGGQYNWGLKEEAVDYSLDQYNEKLLSKEMRARAEQLRKEIISGKLQVPDFYQTKSLSSLK